MSIIYMRLFLNIANHKSRNLWKLHVKPPFQNARMKFTWNSFHENLHGIITWPSSDNVSHEIHEKIFRECHMWWCCMCISSLVITKDIVYFIWLRKENNNSLFVSYETHLWQFVIYKTQLNNNFLVITMRSFIVKSRILTHNYVFSFRYHVIFSRNYETTTLTIYFW